MDYQYDRLLYGERNGFEGILEDRPVVSEIKLPDTHLRDGSFLERDRWHGSGHVGWMEKMESKTFGQKRWG